MGGASRSGSNDTPHVMQYLHCHYDLDMVGDVVDETFVIVIWRLGSELNSRGSE